MGEIVTNFCILYDITRLLARHNARTPSGIDRVELRCALFLLESQEFDVVFVHQLNTQLRVADRSIATELLKTLENRWLSKRGTQFVSLTSLYRRAMQLPARVSTSEKWNSIFEKIRIRIQKKNKQKGVLHKQLVHHLLDFEYRSIFYFNYGHHGVQNSLAYNELKAICDSKIIFYLHDLIPIDYPEYVRKGDEDTHAKRVSAMASYGDLIAVNSNSTKVRFKEFCRQINITPPTTIPLRIGVEDSFLEGEDPTFNESPHLGYGSYFVIIGTIEPRKNHLLLLLIWRRLYKELGCDCPKLVIIGTRGWNINNIVELLDRCPSLKDTVVEYNGLDDRKLTRLLRNARALLAPSFSEGWGMPLVEAMSLGVPVICSDIEAHRESTQGLAMYIDPLNGDAWRRAILQYNNSPESIQAAISKQKSFNPPTWSSHFEDLRTQIEEISRKTQDWQPVERYDQHWRQNCEMSNGQLENSTDVEKQLKAARMRALPPNSNRHI